MKIARAALALFGFLTVAAASPQPHAGKPVAMLSAPGTANDTAARALAKDDLTAASARGDTPLLLTGTANVGAPRPALFVQLQSPQECGSAGCTTAAYLYENGAWRRVLDGATGRLTLGPTRTRGRPDIYADDERFVWTGTAYRSTRPAPTLNLKPRPGRHS